MDGGAAEVAESLEKRVRDSKERSAARIMREARALKKRVRER
jgi:hypothetical protein